MVAQQAYENILLSIQEKKSTLTSLKDNQSQPNTRNHQKVNYKYMYQLIKIMIIILFLFYGIVSRYI